MWCKLCISSFLFLSRCTKEGESSQELEAAINDKEKGSVVLNCEKA